MSAGDFIAGLVYRLTGDYQQVDQVDSRTVGITDNDGRRYLLKVEVDETPHPLIALLDRWTGHRSTSPSRVCMIPDCGCTGEAHP